MTKEEGWEKYKKEAIDCENNKRAIGPYSQQAFYWAYRLQTENVQVLKQLLKRAVEWLEYRNIEPTLCIEIRDELENKS